MSGDQPGTPNDVLDPRALFEALAQAGIGYILVGGLAVAAHGFVRATKDFDICPDPDPENLRRLAEFLETFEAANLGSEDLEPGELPAHDLEGLRGGGNFRLKTNLGSLDLIQYLQPFEDSTWTTLDKHAEDRVVFGCPIRICGYEDLLEMKRAAGRDQDLIDINSMKAARREL